MKGYKGLLGGFNAKSPMYKNYKMSLFVSIGFKINRESLKSLIGDDWDGSIRAW